MLYQKYIMGLAKGLIIIILLSNWNTKCIDKHGEIG